MLRAPQFGIPLPNRFFATSGKTCFSLAADCFTRNHFARLAASDLERYYATQTWPRWRSLHSFPPSLSLVFFGSSTSSKPLPSFPTTLNRTFSTRRQQHPRVKQRAALAAARLRFTTLWSALPKPVLLRHGEWRLRLCNIGYCRWASFMRYEHHRFSNVSHQLKNRREQLQQLRKKTLEKSQQAKLSAITLWKKYGYVGIAVYFMVYIGTLAGFYAAVNYGMLTGDQVNSWINTLHLSAHIKADTVQRVDTEWGKLLLAWVATKVVEPLRLFIALTATPTVARLLKKPWRGK